MPLLLRPFDGMLQPLPDPVENKASRVGAVGIHQRLQEHHRIQSGVIRVFPDLADEGGNLLLQLLHRSGIDALPHQRELGIVVHLAPLRRPGQHALLRHELVGNAQQVGLRLAGKAHEHPALLLDQLRAGSADMALGCAQRFDGVGQVRAQAGG